MTTTSLPSKPNLVGTNADVYDHVSRLALDALNTRGALTTARGDEIDAAIAAHDTATSALWAAIYHLTHHWSRCTDCNGNGWTEDGLCPCPAGRSYADQRAAAQERADALLDAAS